MSRFAVEVVREPCYAVLRTNGYINNLGAERIEQEYDGLVAQGCHHFIVNFADSPIINSMGLAILLGIIEKNLTNKGQIVFCCLTEVNAETMEIMDITQYVTLAETEDDARAFMDHQLQQ
jgi:anti-anti-sigma factor